MESVVVETLRTGNLRGGDAFEVLGDGGTGVIDENRPLTVRPIPYWLGLPAPAGHLVEGHLSTRHLDHVDPDGHLAGRHLTAEHLRPAAGLRFQTAPLYFGVFQFAVRNVDASGNRSAASPAVSRVVNASPRPASGLTKTAFDLPTRRLTFGFDPSPDL